MYHGDWQRTGNPVATPVSLLDLKLQVRLESDYQYEDTRLGSFLEAATELVEQSAGRQLMQATYAMTLDSFPVGSTIKLPMPPAQSVSSIAYVDSDGNSQTLSTTAYMLDTKKEPAEVRLRYNQSWPDARYQPQSVTVTWVAGSTTAADVPERLRQAVVMTAAHWYANREAVAAGNMETLPLAVERLINLGKVAEVA